MSTMIDQQIVLDDDQFELDPDEENNEEPESADHNGTKNKNRKKKQKKKRNKKTRAATTNGTNGDTHRDSDEENRPEDNVEIEFVSEEVFDLQDPQYSEFARVFDHFKINDNKEEKKTDFFSNLDKSKTSDVERMKYRLLAMEDEEEKPSKEDGEAEEEAAEKLSKKKLKKMTRLSVAELKQLVSRPDVVEMHDITARDPKLLVQLKATRNTVPVPRHWCAKRKYLQGKRGFEKPAFDLPEFIKRTGITEMRQAVSEKDDKKSLKQKMREKIRPKMGKIDIDYQKLHDAFFRWQTKPRMSIHGDLYYEGKEFETKLKEKKPGNLTEELKIALGMPTGANADKVPPPWLIAMQRYGPPPSYPSLKIPGLNAPIPEGCSFGYHAGGWGKPPVDEFGRPLYGDVFGPNASEIHRNDEDENIDRTYWGELEDEAIEEIMPDEEEEEEEEEQAAGTEMEIGGEEEGEEMSGLKTPGEGLMTPSGISSSVTAGLETPDMIELRKRKIEAEMESGGETPALYKVLPEKAAAVGASMMGSSKVYDLGAAKKVAGTDVDVTLNPDELELDSEIISARYNQQMREHGGEREDLSEMVSDHAAKQGKKRKQQKQQPPTAASTSDKDKKKQKEFKF